MKLDRIMWGILLLFIGGVLLMQNFGLINFYWWSVWRFWPIFLIIAGVNILFNRNKSKIGSMVSIVILVVTLGFLFFKGQERAGRNSTVIENLDEDFDLGQEKIGPQPLSLPYPADSAVAQKAILNVSGGGASFELKGATDSFIWAEMSSDKDRGDFYLSKNDGKDSVTNLWLTMKGKSKWNVGGNNIDLKLNTNPNWVIHMNMGAGEVDFDLSAYKVREFSFDGGAAALELKMGDLLPITDVKVKTGIAEVKISVPMASGCRIKAKAGLSSKEFSGFNKQADGTFETPNYGTSTHKIFINLDGGLSSFEVKRY
jgi:hypothetical protein